MIFTILNTTPIRQPPFHFFKPLNTLQIKYLSTENFFSSRLMFQFWQSWPLASWWRNLGKKISHKKKRKLYFIFISQEQTANKPSPTSLFFFFFFFNMPLWNVYPDWAVLATHLVNKHLLSIHQWSSQGFALLWSILKICSAALKVDILICNSQECVHKNTATYKGDSGVLGQTKCLKWVDGAVYGKFTEEGKPWTLTENRRKNPYGE